MPTIEGTVERIVFRNEENGYTVARLLTDDSTRLFREDLVTIVGTLPQVNVGEVIECTGDWEHNKEHGHQLRVKSFVAHPPISPKALARYLGSGIVKGIGPKTAQRIVDHFGEQTLAIIELEPARLTEIKGISPAKRDAIVAGWEEQRAIRDIMVFLQSHNISPALAKKIFNQYGQDAINVINENPYQLEQDIYGVGFKTADAIALHLGLPRDSLPRLGTGLKHVLGVAAGGDGHCYLPRDELLTAAAQLLECDESVLPPALDLFAKQKEIFVDEDRVYLGPFFYSEIGVARRIRRLQETPSALPSLTSEQWETLIEEAEGEQRLPLAERQRAAIRQAYESKVSILTGGPGTGKTTTIRALVHILERQRVRYALAAPTGRAARRITEATGRAARTLHRLLEFSPSNNEFLRNEDHPLPLDFVIVDEVS
ncbi:MAG TPA: helix-hairpin-helix domain-containing protein, partial [Ktedonobacterales bacterium]|nr:helix-hairpin-helix domain-containing protein [Ktedonobacterales bacterium]